MALDPNATTENTKKRAPKERYDGEYGLVTVHQTWSAYEHLIVMKPNAEVRREGEYKGGNYAEDCWDGRQVRFTGDMHGYTWGGTTRTTQGNVDHLGHQNEKSVIHSERHEETGKGKYKAADSYISVTKGTNRRMAVKGDHVSTGGSGSPSGDGISMQEGDVHTRVDGDVAHYVKGTRVEATEGEKATYVIGGNTSFVTDKDYKIKGRKLIIEFDEIIIKTIQGDITIISAQNLTANAAAKITENAGAEFKMTSKAKIKTRTDSGTEIEGPSAPAPPTLFSPGGSGS